MEWGEAWGVEECLIGHWQWPARGYVYAHAVGLIERYRGQDAAQILAEAFDEPGGKVGCRGLRGRGWADAVGADCRRHQGYRDNVPCVFHADRGFNIQPFDLSVKRKESSIGIGWGWMGAAKARDFGIKEVPEGYSKMGRYNAVLKHG